MEKLKPLSDFFIAIDKDPRISITHIGLYAALLQYWSEHGFENPVHVFSYEIMKIAKISTKTTYHKIIKDLSSYGYIRYEPSYKRNKGSKVHFSEKCPYE
ncbi:hypothetical protein SAMN05444410_101313 [Hydrobacter penzbergensis]|uniref:Helix-turn-helix domain-containing protein n=1 Tax=Hydrobacter penzbergensis TaxID=1235997 RepID=A0A8X8LCA9_9BACT|nr:hypothetical protein [Hydrobacter penzbergensis]SDW13427.1 hypothetical protein SAMN05444410_101313 [Hydrobacter penzbergensis]